MTRKFSVLTAIFLLLGFLTFAQETTSEIQGIVTDGTIAIGNATIVAIHVPVVRMAGLTYPTCVLAALILFQ
jgi:hypothetical protein